MSHGMVDLSLLSRALQMTVSLEQFGSRMQVGVRVPMHLRLLILDKIIWISG